MTDQSHSLPEFEAGFWGHKAQSLDDKGRTSVPAMYLSWLKDCGQPLSLIVVEHAEGCLELFTIAGFETYLKSLDEPGSREAKNDLGYLAKSTMHKVDVHPKTGRITVPAILRDAARLTQDTKVLFVGWGDPGAFQIWNYEKWQAYKAETMARIRGKRTEIIESGVKYQ